MSCDLLLTQNDPYEQTKSCCHVVKRQQNTNWRFSIEDLVYTLPYYRLLNFVWQKIQHHSQLSQTLMDSNCALEKDLPVEWKAHFSINSWTSLLVSQIMCGWLKQDFSFGLSIWWCNSFVSSRAIAVLHQALTHPFVTLAVVRYKTKRRCAHTRSDMYLPEMCPSPWYIRAYCILTSRHNKMHLHSSHCLDLSVNCWKKPLKRNTSWHCEMFQTLIDQLRGDILYYD